MIQMTAVDQPIELDNVEGNKSPEGLIILNPVSGEGNVDKTQAIIETTLAGIAYDLYRTTGNELLREVVKTAVSENNYQWVAAVGGDGTISLVADGLIGTDLPLAIIPAGTGNVLAEALGIPSDIESASELILSRPSTHQIDAIRVGKQYIFLKFGVGLESVTMKSTTSAQKNRWGKLAYIWNAVKEGFGWQPYQFTMTVDGESYYLKASELLAVNTPQIGVWGLDWGAEITPDDGRIDIAVLRARSLADYARIFWAIVRRKQYHSNDIQYFFAYENIKIESKRPFPLHGDGEILEQTTPTNAVVVPKALTVIVSNTNMKR